MADIYIFEVFFVFFGYLLLTGLISSFPALKSILILLDDSNLFNNSISDNESSSELWISLFRFLAPYSELKPLSAKNSLAFFVMDTEKPIFSRFLFRSTS